MRFRLRTLMIFLALMPPLLWIGWGKYQVWKAEQDRRAVMESLNQIPVLERIPYRRVPRTGAGQIFKPRIIVDEVDEKPLQIELPPP